MDTRGHARKTKLTFELKSEEKDMYGKQAATSMVLAALAAGLSGSAYAANWQFQFTGLDAFYDPAQSYTNLGLDNPISGLFPTLRDQNVNGDQSFGNFAEGDELIGVDILRNGVLYGTLSNDIAVDFRLVLRTSNDAVNNTDQDPLDFTAPIATARIDTERSFFDLFTDQDPGSAWGIALDTSVANEPQVVLQSSRIILFAGLIGEIFDDPGSFDLPALTDEGDPLASLLQEPEDTVAFSISLGNLAFLDGPCIPGIDETGCAGSVRAAGTGEIGFQSAVPAPATLALLGLGLAAIGSIRRRRS
jgi:hypothetical protein